MSDKLYKIVLPCHFGLESVAKYEIKKLGYEIDSVVDGEIKILAKLSDIPILNINLRTVERVLIELSNFKALEFEDLYQGILNTNIEEFIKINDKFIISKANQDKFSKLHSSQSIQSIVKKAMVDRLMRVYNTDKLLENNTEFKFRVKFYKDVCSLRLDTTGESLHKRGYRPVAGLAPIEETLASALILLTPFKTGRVFLDPFCGSGTFDIEAAMIAANIAPGIDRHFQSETWTDIISKSTWNNAFNNAKNNINFDYMNESKINIYGYDIDKNMIQISKENATKAGVDRLIHFETKAVDSIEIKRPYGFIVTNPPYGERMKNDELSKIYTDLKNTYNKLNNWSMHVITSYPDARKYLGKEDKNRKIYNGMLKTYIYSYIGDYK